MKFGHSSLFNAVWVVDSVSFVVCRWRLNTRPYVIMVHLPFTCSPQVALRVNTLVKYEFCDTLPNCLTPPRFVGLSRLLGRHRSSHYSRNHSLVCKGWFVCLLNLRIPACIKNDDAGVAVYENWYACSMCPLSSLVNELGLVGCSTLYRWGR